MLSGIVERPRYRTKLWHRHLDATFHLHAYHVSRLKGAYWTMLAHLKGGDACG